MTLGCQAQQQQQQITSQPDELGVTEESNTDGDFDDIKEEEEECADHSAEEGENGLDFGQSDVAQVSPATGNNMGSFQTDHTTSVMEEDNLVDILKEEDNLEEDLMEDVNFEDGLNGANPDGGDNEGKNQAEENSSVPLLIMAPFNRVFNYTDAKYEDTTENIGDDEKNLNSGNINLDNDFKYQNTTGKSQPTKSVLGLLDDFGTDASLKAGTKSSEMLNTSLNIHQAGTKSGRNDANSFASIQKTHMLYRFICAAILINEINL